MRSWSGHVHCNAKKNAPNKTVQSSVLCGAADRAANVPVYAPVTPQVRIQEGRPAPSTPEKLPERGLRQGVVHAKVEPEREPKVVCNNSCVHVAPRKNEVKQQQDWRLVFVDRPETYQITDCLDELLFGEDIGYDFDLLSRSICASGSGCLSEVRHEVRLRKVQTGPGLGMASLAQLIADEEVSSDSECSRCPGDDLLVASPEARAGRTMQRPQGSSCV